MNRKIMRAAQRVILAVNRRRWGLAINRWIYRRTAGLAAFLLSGRGVIACYVHGSVGRGNIVPGLSDIDLVVVTEEMDDATATAFAERVAVTCRRLRKFIPVLSVFVETVKDLEVAIRTGTLYYHTPQEDWVLYRGRDVISRAPLTPARSMIAWSKLLVRRFFGIQKRHFSCEPGSTRRLFLKVNEGLVHDAERLLRQLGTDDGPLAGLRRFQEELVSNGYSTGEIAFYDRIFPEWFGVMKAVAGRVDPKQPASAVKAEGYRLVSASLPPTLPKVRDALRPFAGELKGATAGQRLALVLSAVPNRHYNFKLYAVVPDDAPAGEVLVLRRILHERSWAARPRFPRAYFSSFPTPMILPEALFRHLALGDNGGLEPHYFKRHGEVFFNTLGRDLPAMDDTASLASALSEGVLHLGFARRRRDLPAPGPKFATSLVDHVTGTLPSMRLLLEKKIIATTPAEATREYLAEIGGEQGKLLEAFASRYAGLDPAALPLDELVAWYRGNFAALKREADAITELHLRIP